MVALLYNWLCFFALLSAPADHPIYVSVTEIEYNAKEKNLEISCRIFTDDFEKTLRKYHSGRIDLLNESMKKQMEPLVKSYIEQHLQIKADGKKLHPEFLGFEQQDEAIASYWQVTGIAAPRQISLFNNLLFEYQEQQMNLVHVTVNGIRKSHRLLNPDAAVVLEW